MRRIKRILTLALLSSLMTLVSCSPSDTSNSLERLPSISTSQEWFEMSFRTKLQYTSDSLAVCDLGRVTGLQTRFGRGSIFTEFYTNGELFVENFTVEYCTYTSAGDVSINKSYVYPVVDIQNIAFLNFSYNETDSEIEVRIRGDLSDVADRVQSSELTRYNTQFVRYKDDFINIKIKRRSNNSLVYKYKKYSADKKCYLGIYNKYKELLAYIALTEQQGDFDGYLDYGGTYFNIVMI